MPDPLGRLLQIRNGSADMAAVQSGKEYEELSRRSDIAILRNPSISTHYLGFNMRQKPFDRKEIRAAFLHIIHKGNMVKQIFQNLAEPAFTPLPRPLFPNLKDRAGEQLQPGSRPHPAETRPAWQKASPVRCISPTASRASRKSPTC